MGIFQLGKPRFRDVQPQELSMPRASKVAFFAPHTSEHGATMPLISRLSERLASHGVESRTYSIDDMRDRLRRISASLSQMRFSKPERMMLETLLRMNDAIIRLGLLSGILQNEKGANVVEVHALDRDYQAEDRFEHKDLYYRLPMSRVLYARDFQREYSVPVREGLLALERISGPMIEAARLLDLDPARIRQQSRDEIGLLGANAGRLALLEVPAPVRGTGDIGTLTRFERSYCINISMAPTLRDEDIGRLAKALANLSA